MSPSQTDLLSLDSVQIAEIAAKASSAAIESLPDDQLLSEVSKVEAELAQALAALRKKKPAEAIGPSAVFEGETYDCGAIAAAAIAAAGMDVDSMSTAELEKHAAVSLVCPRNP